MADMSSSEGLVRERALELMDQAAFSVLTHTITATPRGRTSDLANSIGVDAPAVDGEAVSFTMTASAPYAQFVAEGTRPHAIASHGPWSLRDRETDTFFGRTVQHPGTPPHGDWWSERVLRDRFERGLRGG